MYTAFQENVMLSAPAVFSKGEKRHNIRKGGIFMRYFKVDVRKKPTEYGFMPTMQMYLLEEPKKKRPIVLIVPGGGYIGFSAGGHLCASVSTLWYLAKEDGALYKPDAAILCYAILTARLNHCRDFLENHVGKDEENLKEKLKLAACEEQVSKYTSPTFLYGTFEDTLTNPENMIYYADKLCRYGLPFECHIFPKGGHGAPWCDSTIWAKPAKGRDYNYIRLSVEWMRELFGLLQVMGEFLKLQCM